MAMQFCREAQPFWRFADENGWTGKVELVEHKLAEPLHWRKPRRIFVNSMSDLFHEALPGEAINRIFAVMALCPQHTFQILTKRAERMCEYMNDPDRPSEVVHSGPNNSTIVAGPNMLASVDVSLYWPLENVHLGVSVENQQTADERIPWMLKTPAHRRFVSYEPALGPVEFREALEDGHPTEADIAPGNPRAAHYLRHGTPRIDQIIIGGESGPGARPMAPDWVRSIRDQCVAAGVPFFFKQWGSWGWWDQVGDETARRLDAEGVTPTDQPIRVSKKAAGRLLDGREWNEKPGASQ
jgi:protein gp37